MSINILSRKKFGFRNPNNVLIPPPSKDGVTPTAIEAPERKVTSELHDYMFVTTPDQVQVAPDWVKSDPMFGWAVADGDLMVVDVKAGQTDKQVQAQAEAKGQTSDQEKQRQDEAAKAGLEQRKADLDAMSKAELIDHAADLHGLELTPSMRKDDIVNTILEADKSKQ